LMTTRPTDKKSMAKDNSTSRSISPACTYLKLKSCPALTPQGGEKTLQR
jgi:hypothetical protein